jgi:hypothetical protein
LDRRTFLRTILRRRSKHRRDGECTPPLSFVARDLIALLTTLDHAKITLAIAA